MTAKATSAMTRIFRGCLPARAAARALGCVLQRLHQLQAGTLERGYEPEEDACEHGDSGREREHVAVYLDARFVGHIEIRHEQRRFPG